MNRGEVHQISEKLGALNATVTVMMDLWKTQEASASAGRKALHDKFEMFRNEVGVQIAGLSLRVDRLTDQVVKIEPSVTTLKDDAREHEDEKLREEGAARWRKRAIAGLTAVASGVGYGIHELIGYLKHSP